MTRDESMRKTTARLIDRPPSPLSTLHVVRHPHVRVAISPVQPVRLCDVPCLQIVLEDEEAAVRSNRPSEMVVRVSITPCNTAGH